MITTKLTVCDTEIDESWLAAYQLIRGIATNISIGMQILKTRNY